MSVSVGSMSAGLGLDMSEFQRGMQRATEVARSNSELMSAEMKRTSREGAESLRLIDEAIGVHISRPLTRIIGQTQLVGTALASVFAISAGVAISGVLFEQGKKLLEMTGALEGWKSLLGIAGETAEDTAKQMSRADELVVEGLRHKIEMQDEYNRLVLGLKGADFEKEHIRLLQEGTAELQKQLQAQVALVQSRSEEQGWRGTVLDAVGGAGSPIAGGAAAGFLSLLGITAAKDMQQSQVEANKMAEAMKPLIDALRRMNDEITKSNWKLFRDNADAAAAAVKADIADMQGDMKGWNEEANKGWQTWMKTNEQLEKATAKIGELNALPEAAARFTEFQKINGPAPGSTVAPQIFDLPNTAASQLESFSKDIAAQQQVLAKAVEDAMSPMQREQLTIEKLKIAFAQLPPEVRNTAEAQLAFSAALKQASDQMTQAEIHLRRLQEELQKLLEHSTSASAGMQAFFKQLQIDSSENGKMAFDLMTNALHGFNDEVARGIVTGKTQWRDYARSLDEMALKFALMKTENGLFQQIGNTGFGKVLKNLFSPGQGATQQAPAGTVPPGLPDFLNLPKGAFGALPSSLNPAASTAQFQTAVAQFQAAVAQFSVKTGIGGGGLSIPGLSGGGSDIAGGADSGGDFAASGVGSLADTDIPFFADGGDFDMTPGGAMWVGERGPELLRFGARASGSVVPNSAFGGSGSDTHNHYYDLRGADPAAVEKLYQMLPLIEQRASQRAISTVSEVRRRSRS